MARAYFRLTNPEATDMTLTITMPLREWKEITDQLGTEARPISVHHLQDIIRRAVIHAMERYDYEDPRGKPE